MQCLVELASVFELLLCNHCEIISRIIDVWCVDFTVEKTDSNVQKSNTSVRF